MKVEDLRIGNHVIDLFNNCNKEVDVNDIAVAYKYQHLKLMTIPYAPITLTVDWLKKFGFEISLDIAQKRMHEVMFKIYLPNGLDEEWQTMHVWIYDEYKMRKIEYVHELQNLYHSLSGLYLS